MAVDEGALEKTVVAIACQVNGKLRDKIQVAKGTDKSALESSARAAAAKWTEGKEIVKIVVVPDKLVNIVVK